MRVQISTRISLFCAFAILLFLTLGCTESGIPSIPFSNSQFINKSTDLNWTLFKQGYYDGLCLKLDNNILTASNCISADVNLPYSNCGVGQVTKIDNNVFTCVTLPSPDINKAYADSVFALLDGSNQPFNGDIKIGDYQTVLGVPVFFSKPDYSTATQDSISAGVRIARGDQQMIYNSLVAGDFDNSGNGGSSPALTEWNNEGYADLSDYTTRTYTTFFNACDQSVGNYVLSKDFIMRDTTTNKYYKIKFSSWTGGGAGGGFAYTRTEIIGITGTKNNLEVTGKVVVNSLVIEKSLEVIKVKSEKLEPSGLKKSWFGADFDLISWMGNPQGFIFENSLEDDSVRAGLILSQSPKNSILEFGVNAVQFGKNGVYDESLSGGLFRFDLRPTENKFVIWTQAPGSNQIPSLNISLTSGNTWIGSGTDTGERLQVYGGTTKLAAGTAAYAPLKFTSGTLLTTPQAGAVEYFSDTFYIRSDDVALYKGVTLGTEKLFNGTFTGNADNWTLASGWTYNTNLVRKDGAGTGTLTQTDGNMVSGIVAGEVYTLTYTLSTFTAGNVIPSAGGVTLTTRTSAGTYTQTFKAINSNALAFTPLTTSRFYIDTISLKRVSDGNLFVGGNVNTGTINSGTITATGNIYQDGNIFTNMIYGGDYNKADGGFEVIDLVTPDVYVRAKKLGSASNMNGFTVSDGNLIAQYSGVYLFIVNVSSESSSNSDYGMKGYVNDNGYDECYSNFHTSNGNVSTPSFSCNIRLTAGQNFNLRFDDHSNPVVDLTLNSVNITALRVGN